MRSVLLVGCPGAFRLLLPADTRVVEDETVNDPAVVVVGSDVSNPIFEAQRLARRHRGSTFIVAAGHDRLPDLQLQLQITPFVPLSTRVVLDEIDSVREAIQRALKRTAAARRHRRVVTRGSDRVARPSLAAQGPAFFDLYAEHRNALIRAACDGLPDGADEIVSELLSEDEYILERRAAGGEWKEYGQRLKRRGRISFEIGASERDWVRYYARLRKAFIDVALERDPASIRAAERFFSKAQLLLDDGLGRVRDDFERERRRAETVLHAFVATSPDAVVTMTLDGTITTWNRGAEARFGYPASAIVGRPVSTLVPAALHTELQEHLDAVSRGVVIAEHHTRRVHDDGTVLDVAQTLTPIASDDAIIGVLSVSRDITAELQTKAKLVETSTALQHVERSYQDLYDNAPDLYASIDPASRTTLRCNDTLRRTLGHHNDVLAGRSMLAICHPDSHDEFARAVDEVVETGRVTNVRLDLQHRSGRALPVLLTASAGRSLDGTVAFARCAFRDVSEVVALEARKAAMLEAALDAVVTIDHEGIIVEFNPAAEEMFGHGRDDIVGRPLAEAIIPRRLRDAHDAAFRQRIDARTPLRRRVELAALHRDGHEFPVEISIVRLPDIEPPTFTGFIRDLTEIQAAHDELARTIETLERSNADLERFAYIASHDLQEPLRMVTSFMELLREGYAGQLDETADKFIGHAVDGAQRMKKLINDLLEYSRVDTRATPPTSCNLDQVLTRVQHDLLLALEQARGTMHWPKLPTIWADEGQMEQLLRNLVSNAIRFRHPERDPKVIIRAERRERAWRVVVEDNGIGFDADRGDRIFEMFQRLHSRDVYEGSGIGLAIAKRIIERHRGRIWAESTPGVGSRFFFEIPRDMRAR